MESAEPESRRLFSELVARPDTEVSLAEAALLIAAEEYPDLDRPSYLLRLEEMASRVRAEADGSDDPGLLMGLLGRHMFEEQGFRGNTDEYYDPRNSFLNDVLDRRKGIPITLSIIYLEVAQRIGLPSEGVALPGHFIVKVPCADGDRLVDPFHAGSLLSEADCQERLDRIFSGRVKLSEPMLAGCPRKQILGRMLRNLKGIYAKADDFGRALAIVELLLRVEPTSAEELRDRGLLYAALDCYSLAVRDLEAYIDLVPGAPEASELITRIANMRQRAARVN